MSGAVYARTPNIGLGLIEFDFPNWGDDANANMSIIDGAMSVIGITIKGAWTNNTAYIVGELVVDTDSNTIWRAQIAHTSAATGTFAQDRIANPLYWSDASQALHARGLWTTATAYSINDVVYDTPNKYVWALATRQFVSSSSFNTDVANGDFVIITDTSQAVADAEAAADQAQAIADVMMPDAPSDGTVYGRKDGAWARYVSPMSPGDAPPSSPANGQQWYETDTGNSYVWYDDGTS